MTERFHSYDEIPQDKKRNFNTKYFFRWEYTHIYPLTHPTLKIRVIHTNSMFRRVTEVSDTGTSNSAIKPTCSNGKDPGHRHHITSAHTSELTTKLDPAWYAQHETNMPVVHQQQESQHQTQH